MFVSTGASSTVGAGRGRRPAPFDPIVGGPGCGG